MERRALIAKLGAAAAAVLGLRVASKAREAAALACAESPEGQYNCDKFVARDTGTANNLTLQTGETQTSELLTTKSFAGDNLLTVAHDGTLRLASTATTWDDLRIEPTARTSGVNVPLFSQFYTNGAGSRGVYLYSFDNAIAAQEKELYFTMQMPHDWAGTGIHMHVHWVSLTSATTAAVCWGLEYTWADIYQSFGSTTILTVATKADSDPNVTANKHYISGFAEIVPSATQDGISSIMIGRIFRKSADAADTFTGAAGLLYIDAHYERDSLGSNAEYVK